MWSLILLSLPSLLLFLLQPVLSIPTPVVPPVLEKRYYPQGTISKPDNGTSVMPGQTFDFFYNQRGDYCLSSMNFTVWLFTSPPESAFSVMTSGDVTGWYFGRFAYSGISNEYPKNPAPSQLVMPDFSKSMGGFSVGASASSVPMYLAVIEEWNSCEPTIGHQFSLAANQIIYNATST